MPKVSVLMPSYNHAEFLPATLDSLSKQTFDDWELIAVDDLSRDSSFEILQSWSDLRMRASRNEVNLGTYGTLSKALSQATGEFVAVLDSDDLWEPTKLEKQVDLLERDATLHLCYTHGSAIGNFKSGADVHRNWPLEPVQELLPYLLQENRVLASSVLFRRGSVSFDESLRYSGDWEALLRPAREGPVGFINEPLTRWRLHDRNSHVRSAAQLSEEIRLRQSILAAADFWRTRSIPEAAIRMGLSQCALHLSALYVLEDRMQEARIAARLALSLRTSMTTLKRFLVVSLSAKVARRRLWPEVGPMGRSVDRSLIAFP